MSVYILLFLFFRGYRNTTLSPQATPWALTDLPSSGEFENSFAVMVQEEQRRLSQISEIGAVHKHPAAGPRPSGIPGPFEMTSNSRPSHFRPLTLERALSGKFAVNRISSIRPSQLWKVQQYDPQLNQLETPVPEESVDDDGDGSGGRGGLTLE